MKRKAAETANGDPRVGGPAPSKMHPSNPYFNTPPNFIALAAQFPSLRPFVDIKSSPSNIPPSPAESTAGDKTTYGSINFNDPKALRELTYCLLRRDFSIELDIPLDSLCPAVPNRVNYICWIEDLMGNNHQKPIRGIDIGTGASCIYPLLSCARNPTWKMTATDIDDRSIDFASKNVSRNGYQDSITVLKNSSFKVLPDSLFPDARSRDEQDVQDSLEDKADCPSAVCSGTTNEMMTQGGEVEFVTQMVTESMRWTTRIQWYTSMLGKRSSVDQIVAVLKRLKILNYTLTTFHQGRTARWAVAWSFGEECVSRSATQRPLGKLSKLAPPTTVLSFWTSDQLVDEVVGRVKATLDSLFIPWSHKEGGGSFVELHGRATRNTWARSVRRALARAMEVNGGKEQVESSLDALELIVLEFDVNIRSLRRGKDLQEGDPSMFEVELCWTRGQDRGLFESLFLHLRSRIQPKSKQ